MPDPAQAAVTALTGSTTESVGRFSYDVRTDTWWWCPGVYAIHGFDPGEIVPTTALMAAHQHPDDRADTVGLITAAVTDGKPFCSRHRILDARKRVHTVVTIAEGVRDTDGRIVQVNGYLIDVTDALHREVAAAASLAVQLSAATRATIEQAKGALMITYGLDENEAFAVLRWHSQHSNIKINTIAARMMNRTKDPGIADHTADRKITEILESLTGLNTAINPTPPDLDRPNPRDQHQRLTA